MLKENGNGNGNGNENKQARIITQKKLVAKTRPLTVNINERATDGEVEAPREKANLKLVNMLYDTPKGRLSEFTFIGRRMALYLSMSETFDKYTHWKARHLNGVAQEPILLSEEWRTSFYQHLRSVGGELLVRGVMLAETQLGAVEDESMENPDRW